MVFSTQKKFFEGSALNNLGRVKRFEKWSTGGKCTEFGRDDRQ